MSDTLYDECNLIMEMLKGEFTVPVSQSKNFEGQNICW